MKEAKVKCLCAQFTIKDLGVTLNQGQELWLTADQVRLSKDLKHGKRIGAVELHWKTRAQVTKPPPPPNFRRLSPTPRGRPQVMPEEKVQIIHHHTTTNTLDPDEVAKRVKAAVAGEVAHQIGDLKDVIANIVAAALAQKEGNIDQATLAATLEATLRMVLPQYQGVAAPSAAAAVKSEDPLYIPSGIVPEKTKGKVEVQKASSEGTQVGDAAAALKALKKKRKQDNER